MRFYTPDGRAILSTDGSEVHAPLSGRVGLVGLTTPVSYITSIFSDPYQKKGIPYAYAAIGDGWILYSPGPDRDYDIIPSEDYDGETTVPAPRLVDKTFDPTNGVDSGGDIWRVKR